MLRHVVVGYEIAVGCVREYQVNLPRILQWINCRNGHSLRSALWQILTEEVSPARFYRSPTHRSMSWNRHARLKRTRARTVLRAEPSRAINVRDPGLSRLWRN